MSKRPLIVLARVHGNMVDPRFFQSYEVLRDATQTQIDCLPAVIERLHVDRARNEIVQMCLDPTNYKPPQLPKGADPHYKDASHIMFVDDDMIFPPNTILRLMQHDEPIVGGLYFARVPPHLPIVYSHVAENQWVPITKWIAGLQEVDAIGAGCLLVKREVFEKMSRPWFEFTDRMGEDMWFCQNAKQLGYNILLDADIVCKHLSTVEVGPEHFQAYANQGLTYQDYPSADLKALSETPRPYKKNTLSQLVNV